MSISSSLMNTERMVPSTPEKAAKIKYKVPISLWFVEKSHLDKDQIKTINL